VDPKMAKAMSAHHTIIFVKEVGFPSVIFERDALQVIQALSTAPPFLHSFGHFVESIHHDMQSFQIASFAHCRHEQMGWPILLQKQPLLNV
jgi:hypothetical protein